MNTRSVESDGNLDREDDAAAVLEDIRIAEEQIARGEVPHEEARRRVLMRLNLHSIE